MFVLAIFRTLLRENLPHNLLFTLILIIQWLVKQLMEMIQEISILRVAVDFIYFYKNLNMIIKLKIILYIAHTN